MFVLLLKASERAALFLLLRSLFKFFDQRKDAVNS